MGEEVLRRYRDFVRALPEAEKDMPYLKAPAVCEEDFLTPNQALEHLERQDACGRRLQEMEEEMMRR